MAGQTFASRAICCIITIYLFIYLFISRFGYCLLQLLEGEMNES